MTGLKLFRVSKRCPITQAQGKIFHVNRERTVGSVWVELFHATHWHQREVMRELEVIFEKREPFTCLCPFSHMDSDNSSGEVKYFAN